MPYAVDELKNIVDTPRRCVSRQAKPFLKWAGGKSQLLNEIRNFYPFELVGISKYAEPFVGGGAVLIDILENYELEEVYISDTNAELINAYRIIRDNARSLINMLLDMQETYLPSDEFERKQIYLTNRERFNKLKTRRQAEENIERAALMIFLNRTCFNGLYRVNKRGLFNVPIGAYKKPLICDEENILRLSDLLRNVKIICSSYRESAAFIDEKTFVYFDPPYRPLNDTAMFTAYSESTFGDDEQRQLAQFVDEISERGAKILVSNSDPKNENPDDDFFDNLYSRYRIKRVEATRMINCRSELRGKIKELLISNF